MTRVTLLFGCLLVLAGCGQKGALIAPEPVPAAQPADADREDPAQDEDAEDRRRRGR